MEQSKKQPQHGKKPNQKLKTFVVLQYLQRNTDENHVCNASDIVDYLNECGIAAERRSIYSDIAEINKAMYMIEQGTDINSAAEELEQYEDEKLIVMMQSVRVSIFAADSLTSTISGSWSSAYTPPNS